MQDKIIFLFPISSTVKLQNFGYHFVPNSSPSWLTCEEQMVFIQQHSIMCLLRNKEVQKDRNIKYTCGSNSGKRQQGNFEKKQSGSIQHL